MSNSIEIFNRKMTTLQPPPWRGKADSSVNADKTNKDKEIKRLREALAEIKKTIEDAQDTIYPFHIALDSKDGVYILEITKEALKGKEE